MVVYLKEIENLKPADRCGAAHALKDLVGHPKMVTSESEWKVKSESEWKMQQTIILMKAALFGQNGGKNKDFRDAFLK